LQSRYSNITFLSGIFLAAAFLTYAVPSRAPIRSKLSRQTGVLDSLDSAQQAFEDSLYSGPYEPSEKPVFNPEDRLGDPFSYDESPSPFFLENPSSMKMDYEIDTGNNYVIYEKIGDINFRPAATLTFDEFNQLQNQRLNKEYWQERSEALDGESAVSGRALIPRIFISPVFDRIFGGSYIDIQRNGFATLDFGSRWQRIENPSIPIRQQRNGGFEFDMAISMNVTGRIGEKLAIMANFDNNNSFDFQNDLKVEYTGFEEDIIKKIEIGNVSLPLNNSLITGAQNLFGVKTQLQFGKLYVTSVLSSQRGTSESVSISQGFQGREFSFRASDYEENKHFFLGHYFRDNYERWITPSQQIQSGVNINRVEVYVINRSGDTETIRNFAAFMDLAEGSVLYRNAANDPMGDFQYIYGNANGGANRNEANGIPRALQQNSDVLRADQAAEVLGDPNGPFKMVRGLDFETTSSARQLELGRDFEVNRELGYITLTRPLQNDEILAVAYEYNEGANIFRVGELTEDYQNRPDDEVIFLKLLRPSRISIQDQNGRRVPTWDLMMKNIYSLNAARIDPTNFQLQIIYRDDATGLDNPSLHVGRRLVNVPLVQVMEVDLLNQNRDQQPDGVFDFVDQVTINAEAGKIIFPVLEPFGSHLTNKWFDADEAALVEQFVFDTLYGTTRADAQLITSQNKYFIEGSFQSGSASEIVLPGINVAEGSVRVFAGQTPLNEGTDYTVDYNFGKVRILNEGILNSGKEIKITYERADLFNFRNRTLLGSRFDYFLSDDITFGATILRLNEQPLISRVSVGNEPTRNVKYGFDVNLNKESKLITKIIDKIPGLSTKELSSVTFNAEFAQLLPGTSNLINGEGTSYIDDFENTATPFGLMGSNVHNSWRLSATPQTNDNRLDPSMGGVNDLRNGFRRAKVSWYTIDNIFYRNNNRLRPDHIGDDDLENHYVRPIAFNEIFRNRDRQQINVNENVFDIAFYPDERGSYNYNPSFESSGSGVRNNWGGISRAITTDVDFDKTNVEYLEFWLMDPFIEGPNGVIDDGSPDATNNTTGGKLYFNLGTLSEDVMRDERHAFENGLPTDGDINRATQNAWGVVTNQQYINDAFANSDEARTNQDVGLDGLMSDDEFDYYDSQLDSLGIGRLPADLIDDPSSDDFQYYLGDNLDATEATILERYKNFNGLEGNSPVLIDNSLPYSPAGSVRPNNEDLNNDNTINSLEEYYEYEIDLRPGQLEIGQNNIIDKITSEDGERDWYLFRIPVREPDRIQGNITGFKSIRWMRMYMTEFREPVVLRMVKFQIVGSQWRRYLESLVGPGFNTNTDQFTSDFQIGVVNIEENGAVAPGQNKVPYLLPPGFNRDRDNSVTIERRLNEQSLQLCVDDLQDNDAKAVFKNVGLDLINYGRVQMFLHAQSTGISQVEDSAATAFIRLGTDFDQNYYEIEVPLKVTPSGLDSYVERDVWPLENEINVKFEELFALKLRRDREEVGQSIRFQGKVGNQNIYVVGNPDISAVLALMIGVRNPKGGVTEDPLDLCVWANELRVTDFDRTPGWAANARLNLKLADFGNISATGRINTFGFGSIQDRISQRSREENRQYDISGNLNLDKFLPESLGLRIPVFASLEQTTITPQFDPLNPDVKLDAALLSFDTEGEANDYKNSVITDRRRRAFNFSNVRKIKTNPDAKSNIWDVENFSFTYAWSQEDRTDANTQDYIRRTYKGAVDYNYTMTPISIEPFKNIGALDGDYFALIKDFNFSPLPSTYGFRFDLDRQFERTQLYNADRTIEGINPLFRKAFTFNRSYNLRWQFTKSLSMDYNARANAIIDEPREDLPNGEFITRQERKDSIWQNILNLGRMKIFDQNFNFNYRVPIDKIPAFDFLSADLRYSAGYNWQAGTLENDTLPNGQIDLIQPFGNIISNTSDQTASGKIDLVSLYNKVDFLKSINSPSRSRSGRSARGDTATVKAPEFKALKGILRLIMSLRSINVSYSIRAGTTLPGFNRTVKFFGLDDTWSAPGFDFILGSQSRDILSRSVENDWLVQNPQLTTPFRQTQTQDLNIRADVEPIRDLKIQLTAKKQTGSDYQEIFRVDSVGDFR
jgi:cell surface protein SprA